jgi:nitroreductase
MPEDSPIYIRRFSARDYRGLPIPEEAILSILEAGRWAPSSYNDQPWSFILARRQDKEGFEGMLSCAGGNRPWCEGAGILLALLAKRNFNSRERPNPHAWHDVGLAVMAMTVQAVSLGLQAREYAGIERDKVRELYKVPETHDVVAGLAIGYPSDPEGHAKGRERKALKDFVFEGAWGQPSPLLRPEHA